MAVTGGVDSSVWKFSNGATYALPMVIKAIQFAGASGGTLLDNADLVYVGISGGSFAAWDPPLTVKQLSTGTLPASHYFLIYV